MHTSPQRLARGGLLVWRPARGGMIVVTPMSYRAILRFVSESYPQSATTQGPYCARSSPGVKQQIIEEGLVAAKARGSGRGKDQMGGAVARQRELGQPVHDAASAAINAFSPVLAFFFVVIVADARSNG